MEENNIIVKSEKILADLTAQLAGVKADFAARCDTLAARLSAIESAEHASLVAEALVARKQAGFITQGEEFERAWLLKSASKDDLNGMIAEAARAIVANKLKTESSSKDEEGVSVSKYPKPALAGVSLGAAMRQVREKMGWPTLEEEAP